MSWLRFEDAGTSRSGKTREWAVVAKEQGLAIGAIQWYGPWRKYVFTARPNTVFEQDCLRDIAKFIEEKSREHYAALKTAKAVPAGRTPEGWKPD